MTEDVCSVNKGLRMGYEEFDEGVSVRPDREKRGN